MKKLFWALMIIVIISIGISVTYYFLYLPIKNDKEFKNCLKFSEEALFRKRKEINAKINEAEKEISVLEIEVKKNREDFEKNNPKPPVSNCNNKSLDLACEWNSPAHKWEQKLGSFSDSVRSIQWQVGGLENDLEIIEVEKLNDDNDCYKKFNTKDSNQSEIKTEFEACYDKCMEISTSLNVEKKCFDNCSGKN